MNKGVSFGFVMILSAGCALASDTWSWTFKSARVQYEIYGNSLGDPTAPKSDDSKIAFQVTGPTAQQMFNAMGPDRQDICGAEPGSRFRSKDEDRLVCSRSKEGHYACQFGFDLRSGKSVGGSIC